MKIRCGVIGLGRIGCGFDDDPNKKSISTHASAYHFNKNANLVTLCDIDQDKLSKYGKKYNVSKLYSDYKKMFQESHLDCVSICTLAESHLDIVKEAARNNVKGIFLEKPISDSLKSAKEIVEICQKKNIKLQIDFQRRFDPFYHLVKNNLNSKKFGKIQHCSIYYGGGIANTGSHFIDLIRFFFGDIDSVKGDYSLNISNNPFDSNIDGMIIFKNDTHCLFQGLDVSNYGILELDILGSNARIRLNLAKSIADYFEISVQSGLAYKELEPKPFEMHDKKDAIVLGLENLFNAIENNVETLCTGNDGYLSLEVIVAIIESASNKGKQVSLPLKINTCKISSK